MKKITFTNAHGDTIVCAEKFPYFLQNVRGLGPTISTPLTQKRFQQDGFDYYGSSLEPRYIDFELYIKGSSRADLINKRHEVFDILNPKLGKGSLLFENDLGEWAIEGAIYDGPHDAEIIKNTYVQKFEIGILCPDPSFKNPLQMKERLLGLVGGLQIPFYIPISIGDSDTIIPIDYNGTLDAPLLFEFRGEASMPKITKLETGEYIEIETDLEFGESLFINTEFNNIDVYKVNDGEVINAFADIKTGSNYFQLTRGQNTLVASSASGTPEAYASWNNRYIGV